MAGCGRRHSTVQPQSTHGRCIFHRTAVAVLFLFARKLTFFSVPTDKRGRVLGSFAVPLKPNANREHISNASSGVTSTTTHFFTPANAFFVRVPSTSFPSFPVTICPSANSTTLDTPAPPEIAAGLLSFPRKAWGFGDGGKLGMHLVSVVCVWCTASPCFPTKTPHEGFSLSLIHI